MAVALVASDDLHPCHKNISACLHRTKTKLDLDRNELAL